MHETLTAILAALKEGRFTRAQTLAHSALLAEEARQAAEDAYWCQQEARRQAALEDAAYPLPF